MMNGNFFVFARYVITVIRLNIVIIGLKSLIPIHFVKIRLSNFLDKEFLVKIYKL